MKPKTSTKCAVVLFEGLDTFDGVDVVTAAKQAIGESGEHAQEQNAATVAAVTRTQHRTESGAIAAHDNARFCMAKNLLIITRAARRGCFQ